MNDRRLAFLYSPEVESLTYPSDCPFKSQRTGLTRKKLLSFGLLGTSRRTEIVPQRATRTDFERFHLPVYLDELERAAAGELTVAGFQMGLGGPDTPVFKEMVAYGAWACGSSLTGADLLLRGEADVVFSLLGGFHHAQAGHAGGFCYLNDVVLACDRLASAGQRVAYLDVDAHHGDGVQAAFYRRNDVLTISLHESGKTLYPWGGFENEIGEGPGLGYNVNLPLPAGTYDEAFLEGFQEVALPLLRAFRPSLLVMELGLDTLAGDPLTHLQLTNNAIVDLIQQLLALQLPVLVLGGGGYHIENTVRGWALAWQTFAGEVEEHDFSAGMGGVMLGSSEWLGGFRDPHRAVSAAQQEAVCGELRASIAQLKRTVFPYHGLSVDPASGGSP